MPIVNKDGTPKPAAQYAAECRNKKKQKEELKRIINGQSFRMRGVIISDREWDRYNKSFLKIKNDSSTGATKQIVSNQMFKEFNDKILGEGVE